MERYKVWSEKQNKKQMNTVTGNISYLQAISWTQSLLIGWRISRGWEGLKRLAAIKEAGLDAAEGAEHPGMLAPDLPLELIPLAGNHMEDILQTWRVRDGKKEREAEGGGVKARRSTG